MLVCVCVFIYLSSVIDYVFIYLSSVTDIILISMPMNTLKYSSVCVDVIINKSFLDNEDNILICFAQCLSLLNYI